MEASTSAPPYTSLLDRCREVGLAIQAGGGQLLGYNDLPLVLTGLAHFVEHGDGVLDAAQYGGFNRLEPILTPDRPAGWTVPVQNEDPKEQEILRLKAEIDRLNSAQPDPRDAEIERLRSEAARLNDAGKNPNVPAGGGETFTLPPDVSTDTGVSVKALPVGPDDFNRQDLEGVARQNGIDDADDTEKYPTKAALADEINARTGADQS